MFINHTLIKSWEYIPITDNRNLWTLCDNLISRQHYVGRLYQF